MGVEDVSGVFIAHNFLVCAFMGLRNRIRLALVLLLPVRFSVVPSLPLSCDGPCSDFWKHRRINRVAEPVRQDRIGAWQGLRWGNSSVVDGPQCVLSCPIRSTAIASQCLQNVPRDQDLHDHERTPSIRVPINIHDYRDRGLFCREGTAVGTRTGKPLSH